MLLWQRALKARFLIPKPLHLPYKGGRGGGNQSRFGCTQWRSNFIGNPTPKFPTQYLNLFWKIRTVGKNFRKHKKNSKPSNTTSGTANPPYIANMKSERCSEVCVVSRDRMSDFKHYPIQTLMKIHNFFGSPWKVTENNCSMLFHQGSLDWNCP